MNSMTKYDTLLEDELFYEIQNFVLNRTGMLIPITRKYLFENRLSPLAKQYDFCSINDYFTHISQQSARHPLYLEFIHIIATHETSFFRHAKQLQTFKDNILPQYLTNKTDKTLSTWSAGSSTGEELYSFAMLLHFHLKEMREDFSLTLIGTDISQTVISTAQQAVYPIHSLQNISEHYRDLYTALNNDSTFLVSNTIRSISSFKEDNLPNTLMPENVLFDFIFCRNVLIYFDEKHTMKALYALKTRLKENGLLFVGHSENTKIIQTLFTPLQNDPMIYTKK